MSAYISSCRAGPEARRQASVRAGGLGCAPRGHGEAVVGEEQRDRGEDGEGAHLARTEGPREDALCGPALLHLQLYPTESLHRSYS